MATRRFRSFLETRIPDLHNIPIRTKESSIDPCNIYRGSKRMNAKISGSVIISTRFVQKNSTANHLRCTCTTIRQQAQYTPSSTRLECTSLILRQPICVDGILSTKRCRHLRLIPIPSLHTVLLIIARILSKRTTARRVGGVIEANILEFLVSDILTIVQNIEVFRPL